MRIGMSSLGLATVLILTACAGKAYAYEPDEKDVWCTTCGEAGDCEDYALWQARQHGGTGKLVITSRYGEPHAVLVQGKQVFDVNDELSLVDFQGEGYLACDVATGDVGLWWLDWKTTPKGGSSTEHFTRLAPQAMPFFEKCQKAAKELKQ